MNTKFKLKVQRIGQQCLFDLTWGKGFVLSALLNYPEHLTIALQNWQDAYYNFYRTLPDPLLRGRAEDSGYLEPENVDWHREVKETERHLLLTFHQWLQSQELYEIRTHIAQTIVTLHSQRATRDSRANHPHTKVEIFLTCQPLEIARLPWETWELGAEVAGIGQVRLARTSVNIRQEAPKVKRPSHRKARVLVILGDETGLDFRGDRSAVQSLASLATVEFVGWSPGSDPATLKAEIVEAVAEDPGWDVLFFAGHSNESTLTGGELVIGPGIYLSIQDLSPALETAKQKGLQFALFNSCSGLAIADALIDLGLSQVAIFREPIHNRVAQDFLLCFLQGLTHHLDVHDALLLACQDLKTNKEFTYPSAYLIPSLYRHPETELFRLRPFGLEQCFRRLLPTRLELLTLFVLLSLSLAYPLQNTLLSYRTWIQAIYRDCTRQIAQIDDRSKAPPVLLVQIDDRSLEQAHIANPVPISRPYLAQLVKALALEKGSGQVQILGIDYVFDNAVLDQGELKQAIQSAVAQEQTWFVFATRRDPTSGEVPIPPQVASLGWSLQGYIGGFDNRVILLPPGLDCRQRCPFAYLLALLDRYRQETSQPIQPRLTPDPAHPSLREHLLQAITDSSSQDPTGSLHILNQLRLHPLTGLSDQTLAQKWLQPIIDLSIPPQEVYDQIPAWQVLDPTSPALSKATIQPSIVIIAAGGYEGAGISEPDYIPTPLAINYWRMRGFARKPTTGFLPVFTGGEIHAYAIHHLLNHHLVIPIPDTWMILLAALLAKIINVWREEQARRSSEFGIRNFSSGDAPRTEFRLPGTFGQRSQPSKLKQRLPIVVFIGLTGGYWLISWQVYISGAVLLPIALPTATFWIYLWPTFSPPIKKRG
jgi:hypothetical protein